ncbi:MAG: hypothetical protein D4R57_00380 [Verrucomicrobiales bacterium]|nr:MAG: hypothetical protein D4R57_00380 [Verrucomicrobiales bacterium]
MIKIQIGNNERELGEASDSWIAQHVQERRRDHQSVCVKVILNCAGLNFALATPPCGGGGGGWQPNCREQSVIELWQSCHLNRIDWAVGNLIAFLKQLRRLL